MWGALLPLWLCFWVAEGLWSGLCAPQWSGQSWRTPNQNLAITESLKSSFMLHWGFVSFLICWYLLILRVKGYAWCNDTFKKTCPLVDKFWYPNENLSSSITTIVVTNFSIIAVNLSSSCWTNHLLIWWNNHCTIVLILTLAVDPSSSFLVKQTLHSFSNFSMGFTQLCLAALGQNTFSSFARHIPKDLCNQDISLIHNVFNDKSAKN